MLGYNRINGKYAHLLRTLYAHRRHPCTANADVSATFVQNGHPVFHFLK